MMQTTLPSRREREKWLGELGKGGYILGDEGSTDQEVHRALKTCTY